MSEITNNEEIKEVTKTIKYTTADGEKTLKVSSTPYPYLQNADKVVLKISVSEADAKSTDIEDLKNNTGVIEYMEDDELKASFENYTCGSDGLIYGYDSGMYSVSLLRKDAKQAAIEKNASDIEYLAIMGGVELEG